MVGIENYNSVLANASKHERITSHQHSCIQENLLIEYGKVHEGLTKETCIALLNRELCRMGQSILDATKDHQERCIYVHCKLGSSFCSGTIRSAHNINYLYFISADNWRLVRLRAVRKDDLFSSSYFVMILYQ